MVRIGHCTLFTLVLNKSTRLCAQPVKQEVQEDGAHPLPYREAVECVDNIKLLGTHTSDLTWSRCTWDMDCLYDFFLKERGT